MEDEVILVVLVVVEEEVVTLNVLSPLHLESVVPPQYGCSAERVFYCVGRGGWFCSAFSRGCDPRTSGASWMLKVHTWICAMQSVRDIKRICRLYKITWYNLIAWRFVSLTRQTEVS